ncbi:MAG: carbohydrate ABC transporter permease [Acutalibacter sp.]|jgi:putative aldouronate transport system permease protein|nr:carbohydrate ABC transporter permease [Acutalibacter sp.]
MTNQASTQKLHKKKRFDLVDVVLFLFLTAWGLIILLPFINVIAISFSSYKEYLATPLLMFPKEPELKSYQELFEDGRIWIGYRTTLIIVLIGVPLSLFLTSSMGYALSRRKYPGKKLILMLVLFTMIFQGGIVPLYLVMKDLHLTNTIWSIILCSGMNTFYMILMYNYFQSLPDSLVESARLDGAGEWTILFRVILPLSLPIIATVTLFYSVDKWNEWFNAMVFVRKAEIQPLQLILRSMILDSQVANEAAATVAIEDRSFSSGIKMAAVVVTMLPIMCVYPFLQKHFAKGVMVGAIKA